jgi:ubiquinone/menaquinone biosynthesis C-methylase UbiE
MSPYSLPLSQRHLTKSPNIKRKLPFSSYWAVAQDIIHRTGVREGSCLEINGDHCYFGIAMSQLTQMQIYLMEKSESVIEHITFHLKQNNMTNQIQLIKGDPLQIPIADHKIELVVYRKSIFSWRSPSKTFQEIYRILAPGGAAYLGDDSWNGQKWNRIENKLKDYGFILSEQLNGDVWRQRMENIRKEIIQAGISSFEMNCNGEGLRIIIHRPVKQEKAS